MWKLTAILMTLIAASAPAAAPRAGVMITADNRSVLAMDGPVLTPGTIITLVTINNPQQVSSAVIGDRLPESEILAKHSVSAPYYTVTGAPGSQRLPSLAVAIVGKLEVERQDSAVVFRAGKSGNPIRVRSCTSSEGMHFTLWAGEPLKSTRLWHLYYYLGYDVDPTCQPADYQESN